MIARTIRNTLSTTTKTAILTNNFKSDQSIWLKSWRAHNKQNQTITITIEIGNSSSSATLIKAVVGQYETFKEEEIVGIEIPYGDNIYITLSANASSGVDTILTYISEEN